MLCQFTRQKNDFVMKENPEQFQSPKNCYIWDDHNYTVQFIDPGVIHRIKAIKVGHTDRNIKQHFLESIHTLENYPSISKHVH